MEYTTGEKKRAQNHVQESSFHLCTASCERLTSCEQPTSPKQELQHAESFMQEEQDCRVVGRQLYCRPVS